ncbi:MAG: hypothetical protein M1812_003942 [Candelaria pacifica]|nr:MAG: hypothetical protein M1812_003942 [Candelaria pacifica]
MGVVSSCLGLDRRRNHPENPETSRLLDDDSQQPAYGGIGPSANHNENQIDPRDIERDRKALELIVEHSADNLIDLFALKPQPTHVTASESKADHLGRRFGQIAPEQDTEGNEESDSSEDPDSGDESAHTTTEPVPGRKAAVNSRRDVLLGDPKIGKKVIRGIKRE